MSLSKTWKWLFLILLTAPFLFILFLFKYKADVSAAGYRTVYNARYTYISSEVTKVNLDVVFSQIRSNLNISELSISYPKDFIIYNLKVEDEAGELTFEKTTVGRLSTIRILINAGSQHRETKLIHLSYNQKKLFNKIGNIFEVLIPTIKSSDESMFNVKIQVPASFDAALSFAKPLPGSVKGGVYSWDGVKESTIYLAFGSWQAYKLNLHYYLENDNNESGYAQIALPPETAYQKIFVNKLDPKPNLIKIDDDGNYLALFLLQPNAKKSIIYDGVAQIFSQPQQSVQLHQALEISKQKKYLTDEIYPWRGERLLSLVPFSTAQTVDDVYYDAVTALAYNYDRKTENLKRRQPEEILANPTDSTCREFSDLFISLARERGFYAREMVGFGYTNNSSLRPLSNNQDVLHAWPEYYDKVKKIWVPVDPTWENTSGIDYFSAFDLNHIVFAIHGQDATLPAAAGTYKKNQIRDVTVLPIATLPSLIKRITINDTTFSSADFNKSYRGTIEIENTGNVFLINEEIKLNAKGIKLSSPTLKINYLAPFQKMSIPFFYSLDKASRSSVHTIEFLYNNETIKKITVKTAHSIFLKVALTTIIITFILYLLKRFKTV